jgi:hypothetical protein
MTETASTTRSEMSKELLYSASREGRNCGSWVPSPAYKETHIESTLVDHSGQRFNVLHRLQVEEHPIAVPLPDCHSARNLPRNKRIYPSLEVQNRQGFPRIAAAG